MRLGARDYREELYRKRSHPESSVSGDFQDTRDSFSIVYLSLVPFLVAEYFAELYAHSIPGGLVFPIGYLLFWAFFYTYYRPGLLENNLQAPPKWNAREVLVVLLGVAIWIVKATVGYAASLIVKPRPARVTYHKRTPSSTERVHYHKPPSAPIERKAPAPVALPADLQQALTTLGIPESRNWMEIHKKYRDLAKKYHPDLNPEITDVGRRFMKYDGAYRKLESVRTKYFQN